MEVGGARGEGEVHGIDPSHTVEQCSIACPSPVRRRLSADDRRRQLVGDRPEPARRHPDPGPVARRRRGRGGHLPRPVVPLLPDEDRLLPRVHRGRGPADPAQHGASTGRGRPGPGPDMVTGDDRADRPTPLVLPHPRPRQRRRRPARQRGLRLCALGLHRPGADALWTCSGDPTVVHAWWAYVEDRALSWTALPPMRGWSRWTASWRTASGRSPRCVRRRRIDDSLLAVCPSSGSEQWWRGHTLHSEGHACSSPRT